MAKVSVIGSIVIPAHNEAFVIGRCLDALLAGFKPGELNVVVACNGCTDDTAEIVRRDWSAVHVLETTEASKAAALRAADAVLTTFPRLYLDADVTLPSASARMVIERLRSGPALAARPPIRYDADESAILVRNYYRARARVPSVMNSLWGAGIYGISAEGRKRFEEFPDLLSDDLFVDQLFDRSEIEIVASDPVVVSVPRRTNDLFRILRRSYTGNSENRRTQDGRGSTARSTARGVLATARLGLGCALDAACYLAIVMAARGTLKVAPPRTWERDQSSRGVT